MSFNKKRYYSLDFIKTLAIFLVCFYHFSTINVNFIEDRSITAYVTYYIYGFSSICVPLFFMVNGALMLNKDYNFKVHIKKLINLIVLIFIWGAIQLLTYAIIYGDTYTIKSFIYGVLNWTKGRIDSLWFLQTLICLYIIFPIVKEIYDKEDKTLLNYMLFIVGLATFGLVFMNMCANVVQWSVGKINLEGNFFNILMDPFNPFKGFRAYSLIYFIGGAILINKIKENKINISNFKIGILLFLSLLLLFLYGVMMTFSNGRIYDTVFDGYGTIMTFTICVLVFIIAFRNEEKLVKLDPVIRVIGSNTLGIYLLQGMVGAYLRPIYKQISFNQNIFVNIIFTFIIVIICLFITMTLKKIPIIKKIFEM